MWCLHNVCVQTKSQRTKHTKYGITLMLILIKSYQTTFILLKVASDEEHKLPHLLSYLPFIFMASFNFPRCTNYKPTFKTFDKYMFLCSCSIFNTTNNTVHPLKKFSLPPYTQGRLVCIKDYYLLCRVEMLPAYNQLFCWKHGCKN